MMKGLTFLLLGAAGAQAQTVCQNDSNGDGRVGVDGKPAAARPPKHGRGHRTALRGPTSVLRLFG
jgi:hypothetical protein